MPTESKSETPRTKDICDAINATLKPYSEQYFSTATAMLLIGQFIEIAKIEKELNEAKRELVKTHDYAARSIAVQKETEQTDYWRGQYMLKSSTCDQLAKENKMMREALELLDDYFELGKAAFDVSDRFPFCIRAIKAALQQPNTTNLIVLTRNELIAEIEKMPCGCQRDPINGWHLRPDQKCHRCQWLARVKGQ